MNDSASPASARRLRGLALLLTLALIALVVLWQRSHLLLGVTLTLPLWAPLPGLLRHNRRTYAWATLCVIPYFVLGLTETIANPLNRSWSAVCLSLALALFVVLIGYLRVTRERK